MRGPNGAFYTSQDADLDAETDGKFFYSLSAAARTAVARQPRIDKNQYARENGWAAAALALLSDVSGEKQWLEASVQAASWAVETRRLQGGGFGHGSATPGVAYLGDSVAMGDAALALYRATGERRWLDLAVETGAFVAQTFRVEGGGYRTAPPTAEAFGVFKTPVRHLDENMAATRFFNLLNRYTGDAAWADAAQHGMGHLAAYAEFEVFLPHALLPDAELAAEPAHATIVGQKDAIEAQALLCGSPPLSNRILPLEWWDKREGPLPNPDVTYPELDVPAAFACANGLCSLPVFTPEGVAAAIKSVEMR